jgi:hypothetical protein
MSGDESGDEAHSFESDESSSNSGFTLLLAASGCSTEEHLGVSSVITSGIGPTNAGAAELPSPPSVANATTVAKSLPQDGVIPADVF